MRSEKISLQIKMSTLAKICYDLEGMSLKRQLCKFFIAFTKKLQIKDRKQLGSSVCELSVNLLLIIYQ